MNATIADVLSEYQIVLDDGMQEILDTDRFVEPSQTNGEEIIVDATLTKDGGVQIFH